jgi:putative membrane protein
VPGRSRTVARALAGVQSGGSDVGVRLPGFPISRQRRTKLDFHELISDQALRARARRLDARPDCINRTIRLVGLVLGLAVVAWLVAHADATALLRAFWRVGWGFLLILAARAATILVGAGAWYLLMPAGDRPPAYIVLPLRWIAESINTTLPAAQIGGEFVRARLIADHLPIPAQGAASVVVDFALSLFAQILFTLFGLMLLARAGEVNAWWWAALSAALVPAFALFGWELLARRRLLAATQRWAVRLGRRRFAAALEALGTALGLIVQARVALFLSLWLQILGFLGHAGEVWLTLYLMGVRTGVASAMFLESLSLAARSAALLIPSGWGAQEAALVALAGLAGLSPDAALALGLIKRAREYAIGLPGLAAWGLIERRRRSAQRQAG